MVTAFQGAIIAAGRGDRLRASGGAAVPKPLVMLDGQPLLARQARAMLAVGASDVLAVINSETAALLDGAALPDELAIIVRDTESSMESLLTLGEYLRPGHFLMATVDSIVPDGELARFVAEARTRTMGECARCEGVLAVVRWRGDKKPLFTEISPAGLITSMGEQETTMVTAGVYWLPTAIFRFAEQARARRYAAMRAFLGMLPTENIRLGAVEIRGAIDIDEAADLDAARRMVEKR